MTTTPSPLETRVRRVLAAWPGLKVNPLQLTVCAGVDGKPDIGWFRCNEPSDEKLVADAIQYWGPPPAPEPFKVGEWVRFTEGQFAGQSFRVLAVQDRGKSTEVIDLGSDARNWWFSDSQYIERCPPPQTSPVGSNGCASGTASAPLPSDTLSQPASLPEPAKCGECGAPTNGDLPVCVYCEHRTMQKPDNMPAHIGRVERLLAELDRKPIAPRFPEPTMAGMVGRVGGRMAASLVVGTKRRELVRK